jgi:hypothetical protein
MEGTPSMQAAKRSDQGRPRIWSLRRTERNLGDNDETAELAINTIRTLSMDAVQAANSGHPGTPVASHRWSTHSGIGS